MISQDGYSIAARHSGNCSLVSQNDRMQSRHAVCLRSTTDLKSRHYLDRLAGSAWNRAGNEIDKHKRGFRKQCWDVLSGKNRLGKGASLRCR